MRWNWQQPDWPNFSWNARILARAEERFLVGSGVLVGALGHVEQTARDDLTAEAMVVEAVTTSEIEGETLDRESVQSSLRRALGFAADHRRARPAETGIAELMVTLYRDYAAPLDHDTLHAWHRMVMRGRGDLAVGGYRTHAAPMQVVSGAMYDPKVHFEAPPSASVPREMDQFVAWFNRTAPGGAATLPAITRAGIAHIYFESIHPYEDGNGRLGRAISEKALAQCLGRPSLTALAATILRYRSEYYEQLEAANKRNELTEWLRWFGGAVLEAQERANAQVEFTIRKTRLLHRVQPVLNDRQGKALARMLAEGPDGFTGGMSASKYTSITKAPPATATRDLADMVQKGALRRTGEKKGARYHLTISVPPVRRMRVTSAGEVASED